MAGISNLDIEHSPLERRVTRDGITVQVLIYKFAGINDAWTLEVIDSMSGQTVWDQAFADDQVAFDTFEDALEEQGIRSFVGPPVQH